jgi:hypothetical protein
MYPTALTPEEFEQENSQLAKLKTALQHVTYSKPRDTYLAKELIGFKFDPKLELFIENLAMRIDELAGTNSERMKYELEKLWIEVHIETELEYANTQPKHNTTIDLPWLD